MGDGYGWWVLSLIPDYWVSIDPGDRYVGFATWHGEHCVSAKEMNPNDCLAVLERLTGVESTHSTGSNKVITRVVCEKWKLYPWMAQDMFWNEFLTCQLIGVIKYICNRTEVEYVGQDAEFGKRQYKMDWYKKLTNKEKRALPWWGQLANGDHAKDAWIHGKAHIDAMRKSQQPPPRRR